MTKEPKPEATVSRRELIAGAAAGVAAMAGSRVLAATQTAPARTGGDRRTDGDLALKIVRGSKELVLTVPVGDE